MRIPVAKPLLPPAAALLPYLREIDRTRRYANRGPLVQRLEARLARLAGADGGDAVALVSSGTAALGAALGALRIPAGRLCMIPAWTFAASAHAATLAGLTPWLVDVDVRDGTLSPEHALAVAERSPGPLGAVMPIAPFGLPLDPAPWIAFRARTGIPVVIDAAAAIDSQRASPLPAAVSLHATKVLACGEGGFVISSDRDLIRAVRQYANFGFAGSREAAVRATNVKLSEYSAAVGLASLDRWDGTRAAFLQVAARYRAAFDGVAEIQLPAGYGVEWVASTTIVRLPPGRVAAAEAALAVRGIDSRRWWGDGLASHAAFAAAPRTELPATQVLAATTLGLPCWPDLPFAAIAETAAVVIAAARA